MMIGPKTCANLSMFCLLSQRNKQMTDFSSSARANIDAAIQWVMIAGFGAAVPQMAGSTRTAITTARLATGQQWLGLLTRRPLLGVGAGADATTAAAGVGAS